jgi:hypothetical protein
MIIIFGFLILILILVILDSFLFGGNISIKIVSLIALISVIGFVYFGLYSYYNDPRDYQTDYKYKIIALKDNKDIDGKFHGGIFISSGYISESLYYYYAINTPKGKIINKVPADITYINELNKNQTPTIECRTHKPIHSNEIRDIVMAGMIEWGKECILNIPEGTLENKFDIDLE